MEYFAKKLGKDKATQDYRYTVGLLHDVDWDVIDKDPEQHLGQNFEQIISELGLNQLEQETLISDIRSHYPEKWTDEKYKAS